MKSFVDDLRYWRAERPDEWKMDEFIRQAEALIAENDALKASIPKLKADAVREAVIYADGIANDEREWINAIDKFADSLESQAAKGE